jgi:hypothetical protein
MAAAIAQGFVVYLLWAYGAWALARYVFRTSTGTALWVAGGLALVRLLFVMPQPALHIDGRVAAFVATALVWAVLIAHGTLNGRKHLPPPAPPDSEINEVR